MWGGNRPRVKAGTWLLCPQETPGLLRAPRGQHGLQHFRIIPIILLRIGKPTTAPFPPAHRAPFCWLSSFCTGWVAPAGGERCSTRTATRPIRVWGAFGHLMSLRGTVPLAHQPAQGTAAPWIKTDINLPLPPASAPLPWVIGRDDAWPCCVLHSSDSLAEALSPSAPTRRA